MKIRAFIILIAIIECVVALVLYRMGLEYISLLIGGIVTYMIAELLRPERS